MKRPVKRNNHLVELKGVSSNRCHRCNHHLTRTESVEEGFGPVCIHEILKEKAMNIYYEQAYKRVIADRPLVKTVRERKKSSLFLWKRNKGFLEENKW